MSDVRKIYNASSHRQAVAAFKYLRHTWQRVAPKAVVCIAQDIDALLVFLQIPIKEYTVNLSVAKFAPPTSLNAHSVRSDADTRPMGCFTNNDSVSKIIYAIFNRLNSKWQDKPLAEFTQFI